MTIFLKLASLSDSNGTVRKGFVTLPGQKLTRTRDITPDILVKAAKGHESRFQTERSKGIVGSVYYTTTLRQSNGCYTAEDVYPVSQLKDTRNKDTESRLLWETYRQKTLNYPARRGYNASQLVGIIKELAAYFCLNIHAAVDSYRTAGIIQETLAIPGTDEKITTLNYDCSFHTTEGPEPRLETVTDVTLTTVNPAGDITERPISDLEEDCTQCRETLAEIYSATVRIIKELKDTCCPLDEDSRVIESRGVKKTYFAETWPTVQELFDRKGFRAHSILMSGDDYLTYGDSAYWIDYLWLFPRKK